SEVTSHKETSCISCVSSSSTGTTSAGASAFAKKTGAGGEVSAQAQASTEGKNSSSLNFYSKTVTDSQAKKSDSVASNVTFGDKGAIVAGNTSTIQGSNVATTAGDLVLKGKDASTTPVTDSIAAKKPNSVVIVSGDTMAGYTNPSFPKTWAWQQTTASTKAISGTGTACVWIGPSWGT
ncbi:hypothetical protein OY671_010337, partial [Metschnikowia pulcherrima]